MSDQIRVRYAPSPTGEPHVGNIRTALFNWLFARHMGGKFVVRIEDTDVARKVDGSLEAILDALRWLGLDWDEGPEVGGIYGPYIQSERLELYQMAADTLVRNGDAYYCYCSPQRLKEMRDEQARRKEPTGYDRRCRGKDLEEYTSKPVEEFRGVVRFKMPLEEETSFQDIIRGEVTFANRTMDDFVILKSDGYPTYHLASVVDDNSMEISHVMRSDEWVSSTPKHVLLYEAMGYKKPLFAHLPIILGPDRSKLSKRHGVVSILHYRDTGFLPEVVLNFLALLGWSLDDRTEIISRTDLVGNFSLDRIGKSGAIFDHEKLTWMNGMYIRQMGTENLLPPILKLLDENLSPEIPRPIPTEYVSDIIPLVQERLKTITEAPSLMDFFFSDELKYPIDNLVQSGLDRASTVNALEETWQRVTDLDVWSVADIETTLRSLAEELNLKAGQLFGTIRVAITGRKVAPPLFETMAVLGRDRSLHRLRLGISLLRNL